MSLTPEHDASCCCLTCQLQRAIYQPPTKLMPSRTYSEAEVQRRIDEAVAAEREKWRKAVEAIRLELSTATWAEIIRQRPEVAAILPLLSEPEQEVGKVMALSKSDLRAIARHLKEKLDHDERSDGFGDFSGLRALISRVEQALSEPVTSADTHTDPSTSSS